MEQTSNRFVSSFLSVDSESENGGRGNMVKYYLITSIPTVKEFGLVRFDPQGAALGAMCAIPTQTMV